MATVLHQQPELNDPVLIACWPGIGDIGVIAVDALRRMVGAQEFGEIEPWDFFYPKKVLIRQGELREMEFPGSRFYFKKREGERDLLFFLGEEQPGENGSHYAEGTNAYRMANLVLDVAQQFGCRRAYTSGAAVTTIHHTMQSAVWVVPNSASLLPEVRRWDNTLLMSRVPGTGGQGAISGLNGLLLGVARKRGIDAVCLMGEIPVYLQGFPLPYPGASQSVLEVLGDVLSIPLKLETIAPLVEHAERQVESVYQSLPAEIREQLDKLKQARPAPHPEAGPITEEDKKKILEDIEKLFKKEPKKD